MSLLLDPRRYLSICGLQIQTISDVKLNLDAAEKMMRANPGHDLYVLPELSSAGYGVDTFHCRERLAEPPLNGPSFNRFSRLAVELDAFVAYGILRRNIGDTYYICHVVVGPHGRPVCYYDKMHLCDMGACAEGAQGVTAGAAEPCAFYCRGWTVGLCICYDLRFPELWRDLAWKRGADVVVHPSAFFRDATFPSWHAFVCARAVENQVYVVSVSHAGEDFGGSIAHPPWLGPVADDDDDFDLAPALADDAAPCALVCRLDRRALDAVRRQFPYRKDARMFDGPPVVETSLHGEVASDWHAKIHGQKKK